jgi:hypothetical protein
LLSAAAALSGVLVVRLAATGLSEDLLVVSLWELLVLDLRI